MRLEKQLTELCLHSVGASDYLRAFEQLTLPKYKSEDYQRTDVSKLLSGNWQMAERRLESKFDAKVLPKGASFIQAKDYTKALPKPQNDPLLLLALAFNPNAMVLHLEKGIKLAETLDYDSILEASHPSLFAHNLYIILEEDAELHLIRRHHSQVTARALNLNSVQIYAGKGSNLCFTDIDNTNDLTERISSLYLYQEAESNVRLNNFSLRSKRTRNNFYCYLRGEKASLNLGGLVLNDGKNHIDNFSYIAHEVPNCQSNELFKYILQDQSYGVFTGRILVAKDAQKTEAFQNNRNLLLSSEARMQAKPQLEIYADDVKCSHGMTTGQLDTDALFYMRQRGISLEEAKRLLSIAFADDVLKMLRSDSLREHVLEIISEQLSK